MLLIKIRRGTLRNIIGAALFLGAIVLTNSSYARCEKDWIKSKSSDGSVIVLSMGSVWEIDSMDRIDSMLWLPVDDVLVCDEGYIINTGSGEKVGARQLS